MVQGLVEQPFDTGMQKLELILDQLWRRTRFQQYQVFEPLRSKFEAIFRTNSYVLHLGLDTHHAESFERSFQLFIKMAGKYILLSL